MTDLRAQLQSTLGAAYTIDRELDGGGMSRVLVAEEVALSPRCRGACPSRAPGRSRKAPMKRALASASTVISLLLTTAIASAQQVVDTAYRPLASAKHAPIIGPRSVVVIDQAHHNFHTASGRYLPFARLLEDAGYVVRPGTTRYDSTTLASVGVLVIANAVNAANVGVGRGNAAGRTAEGRARARRGVRGGGDVFRATEGRGTDADGDECTGGRRERAVCRRCDTVADWGSMNARIRYGSRPRWQYPRPPRFGSTQRHGDPRIADRQKRGPDSRRFAGLNGTQLRRP